MRRIAGWQQIGRKIKEYQKGWMSRKPYKGITVCYFPRSKCVRAYLSINKERCTKDDIHNKYIDMTDNLIMILGNPMTWKPVEVKKIMREYIEKWEEK